MSERPSYTRQQAAAIETRKVSIGLSAGAGCGKTFVLTERFLSHLVPQGESGKGGGEPLSQIVAITFTDRAAREMRDRIRSTCARRIEKCGEAEVPHWLSVLRSIDGARISTIHSFCAGFLRRHAVAAGVDPQFGLMEAETGDTLVRMSIARTVKRLLEQGDENCLKLVVHYGLNGMRRMLGQLLSGQATLDTDRFWERDARQFASEWVEHLNGVFLPRLVRDFATSDHVAQIILLLRENESSNAVMRQRRGLLLDRLESLRSGVSGVSSLEEIREAAQVKGAGNKSTWPSEETYEAVKAGFERLRKEIDKIGEFMEIDVAAIQRSAELTVAAVNVVRSAAVDLATAKQEASLLGFDDLLVRTRNLLRQSEAVRRETAASIAALLVDEFQDTDPVQAEIVETLVGDGLASGKLFVVGDAKQSIYRFRRADPTVFDAMRARIPSQGRLPLTTNFRSQPEILNFVNALFAPALKAAYEPLVPNREQLSPTPSIEFLFALPAADEEDPDRADCRRRREAEWMARRIQELLDDPAPRIPEKDTATGETRLRRVQAGDIAVLFRALSDVALYEDVFRRRGIDYYLVGGRAFFAQQEVYDLVNLCGFLNDPDDAIALVGVLRSPFFSFDDDTLVALGGFGEPLRESLANSPPSDLPERQQEQVRHASRVLDELLRKKDRLPLAGLLELAIERTGYDASLLHEFLGRRKVANLRKLIDMAREFDRSGRGTLADFAQRLRDSISEETVEELAATHPETSNVVRLMTIHQSKGLEFPVVIVADMDRPSRGSVWEAVYHREFGPLLPPPPSGIEEPRHIAIQMNKYIEDREDEEESLRVLYVALTRAADHLILSSALYSNGRPRSQWLKLLAERFDLGTGLAKGDPYFGTSLGKGSAAAIPEILVHQEPPEQIVVAPHKSKLAPLSQFREIVEQGESGVLPSLMRPVSPSHAVTPQFSVSVIEQADAFLRGTDTAWPVLVDPLDANDLRGRDDPTVLGTVVHSVIDRLPWSLTKAKPRTTKRKRSDADAGADTEPIAAIVHAALRGLSPSDKRKVSAEPVIQRVEAFVGSELWKELTGAQRWFREIDFLLPWPVDSAHESEQAIISGQLDCLVQTAAGGWKIVDYKTGRVPEGDPAALFEHFSIQLVLYAQAVRAMTGRLPDSIEIVALHEEIRRFPLTLWKEFLVEVTHRIDAAVGVLASGGSARIGVERPA
jgi:ATP-dependent helicase/nuclease subunit A